MSHCISAIVTKKTELLEKSSIPFRPLPQGFAILIDDGCGRNRKQLEGQDFLAVWTDYFGGFGEQGCTLVANEVSNFDRINDGLKILGVVADQSKEDEFDAIGLGRFRHNEDIYDEQLDDRYED